MFQKLLNQGRNPYEVFKQRDVDIETQKNLKREQLKVKEAISDCAEKIVGDVEYARKQDMKDKLEKEYEKKQRDELGRHVTEERNKKYIQENTVSGTDIIDPTGKKFRIEPSQVTTIVDKAFGLGYNMR